MNMEESLAWLRAPETEPALGDLLCGLIRDIRLILVHSDLGSAAKLGAITETVDQLAPQPGPAASGAQAAASVVALLARNTGPATILFEKLAGEQVRIELTGCAARPLTPAECRDLRIGSGARGYERTGSLRTVRSGLVVAEVSSLVVPGQAPCVRAHGAGNARRGRARAAALRRPAGQGAGQLRRAPGAARRAPGARPNRYRGQPRVGRVIGADVARRPARRAGKRAGDGGAVPAGRESAGLKRAVTEPTFR